MLETPALEIVIALVGLQLAAFLYLYYRYRNERRSPARTANADANADAGADVERPAAGGDRTAGENGSVVECADCGAENDPSYRYCRRCVADLAGEPIPDDGGRSPAGRLF